MNANISKAWLALVVITLSGCWGGWSSSARVERAKRYCAEHGALDMPDTPEAPGYLMSGQSNAAFSFGDIAKELIGKRLLFLEMPINDDGCCTQLFNNAMDRSRGAKFFRLYIAEVGDKACRAFEEELKSYPSQKLPLLRQLGLPINLCIASVAVETPISRYEVRVTSAEKDRVGKMYDWFIKYELIERSTGRRLSGIETNGFVVGSFRGSTGWACNNQKDVKRFLDSAITPVADQRILPPAKVNVQQTIGFPVSYQLKATLLNDRVDNKKIEKRAIETDVLRPVADSGRAWLADRAELHVISDGVEYIGSIPMGEEGMFGLSSLRVRDDDLYFVIEPGVRLNPKELLVVRYSKEARPIAKYVIELPGLRFESRNRYWVERVIYDDVNNAFDLTIHDIVEDRHLDYIAIRTYELRAQ